MPLHDAKAAHNKAVERFWIWTTGALVVAYVFAALAAGCGPLSEIRAWTGAPLASLFFLVAFLAIYRIIEILAVSFRLHVLAPYRTDMPAHALVLTFVGYLQVMLCFAILFLADAFFFGDRFSKDHPIWSGPLDAVYFSTVTIATLGFGDFAPTHWLGKLLVVGEVFVGLILILVAFGRVLASMAEGQQRCEADGKRNDAETPH
jgi:hypothetical protein